METKKGRPGWVPLVATSSAEVSHAGKSQVPVYPWFVLQEGQCGMPHVELPFFSSLSFFSWRHFQTTFLFQLGEAT